MCGLLNSGISGYASILSLSNGAFYTDDPQYMRGICYGPMSVCVCVLSQAHFLSKQLDRLSWYWHTGSVVLQRNLVFVNK